jgi:type IV pilus assembly protein PilO
MSKLFEQLAAIDIPKILILALGLTFFYWYAMYDDGSVLDASIAQVSTQVQEEEKKKADTDATLQQVKEMQTKIGQLSLKYQEVSKRLPSVLFSSDINKTIDEFARASGVSVKTKKPSDVIKKPLVEEVPVAISAEGTYAELAQFTYLVSSAERMSRGVGITISLPPEGGKKLKYEGDVVGYKLAPEEQTPKPAPADAPPPAPGAQQ